MASVAVSAIIGPHYNISEKLFLPWLIPCFRCYHRTAQLYAVDAANHLGPPGERWCLKSALTFQERSSDRPHTYRHSKNPLSPRPA